MSYNLFILQQKIIDNLVPLLEQANQNDWTMISKNTKEIFSEENLDTMRDQARIFSLKNPYAKSALKNVIKFSLGSTVDIQANTYNLEVQKNWEIFEAKELKHQRKKEILKRIVRDGEVFIRFFYLSDGSMKIRFVEPEHVVDVNNQIPYGVQTQKNDVTEPVAYLISVDGVSSEIVKASQILHVKINVDENVRRGRTEFEPNLKDFVRLESIVENIAILVKIRTALVLFNRVQSWNENISKTGLEANKTGSKYKGLRPGSVVTGSEKDDWEFKSPNLGAVDLKEIVRMMTLRFAAAWGLPEYMVTGDASNANYASTWVSESPGLKTIEDWQTLMNEAFRNIYIKVMKHWAQNNLDQIDYQYEIQTKNGLEMIRANVLDELNGKLPCNVVYQPLISRDPKKEAETIGLDLQNGLISMQTARAKRGYDHETEKKAIAFERVDEEDNFNRLAVQFANNEENE